MMSALRLVSCAATILLLLLASSEAELFSSLDEQSSLKSTTSTTWAPIDTTSTVPDLTSVIDPEMCPSQFKHKPSQHADNIGGK